MRSWTAQTFAGRARKASGRTKAERDERGFRDAQNKTNALARWLGFLTSRDHAGAGGSQSPQLGSQSPQLGSQSPQLEWHALLRAGCRQGGRAADSQLDQAPPLQ